jgi:hypothetical protein
MNESTFKNNKYSALFTAKFAKNAKHERFLYYMFAPKWGFISALICGFKSRYRLSLSETSAPKIIYFVGFSHS